MQTRVRNPRFPVQEVGILLGQAREAFAFQAIVLGIADLPLDLGEPAPRDHYSYTLYADPEIARQFDDEWTNVLFVGRIIPNKRIENVIRSFAAYKSRYNHRSRLLIVGSYGGFERYLIMLHHLIARLGVTDVHLLGQVSNEELTAFYDVADLFLCASEHEGFCVPLMEAFYKRIPVLALARTAGRRRFAVRSHDAGAGNPRTAQAPPPP